MAKHPRVSIGLPVFNGERYVASAIESVLAQTHTDFELVISDNGSTDSTEKICSEYARRDPRIRYLRSPVNRGLAWNHRRVFEACGGEYFKWLAHDDMCEPTFIEACIDVLDAMPDVVLCYTWTRMVDESNQDLPDYEPFLATYSPDPCRRFHDLLRIHNYYFQIQGMMRRSVLERTNLLGGFVASDIVLLAELSLTGRFYQIPERLFRCRIHSRQSVHMSRYARATYFVPGLAGRLVLPHWRLLGELFRCVQRVQLGQTARARCYFYLLCWPVWNLNWGRMAKDVVVVSNLLFVRYFGQHLRRRGSVAATTSE